LFNMDDWLLDVASHGQSTLDLFDSLDPLDFVMSRNICWLRQPEGLIKKMTPHKYRITMDCSAYDTYSMRTEVRRNHTLTVTGKRKTADNECRVCFDLPDTADVDKFASFIAHEVSGNRSTLVVEFPLNDSSAAAEIFTKTTVDETGAKSVHAQFKLSPGIDISSVHITCKDRDLVVKMEQPKVEGCESRRYIYKQFTMPHRTNFEQMKCFCWAGEQLQCTAPLNRRMTSGGESDIDEITIPIAELRMQ